MKRGRAVPSISALILLLCAAWAGGVRARPAQDGSGDEFGPVVRAYLGYLRNEQDVVDDRKSRREVSAAYYRRNSNRIRALRQMAIRIALETGNDYLPELEAAARDELGNLFEHPPLPRNLRVGEVLNNTFRFLGVVRAGETFYLFARLDPYEQAELLEKGRTRPPPVAHPTTAAPRPDEVTSRPRRENTP